MKRVFVMCVPIDAGNGRLYDENIQYFRRLTKGSSVSIREMTAAMLFYLQGLRDWMKN